MNIEILKQRLEELKTELAELKEAYKVTTPKTQKARILRTKIAMKVATINQLQKRIKCIENVH